MTGSLIVGPQIIFLGVSSILLFAAAVAAVVCKPILGLWALAAVFVADSATPVPLDTSVVMVGGVHVYPADVLSVVLIVATIVNVVRRTPPARIMVPLSVAGVMFAMNLYRGIPEFGLQHAVNESREYLYVLVVTAFVVSAGPWSARFWRPLFALTPVLLVVAWVGLARHGVHPVTSSIMVGGKPVDSRPLTAAAAIVLACGLIVILGYGAIPPRVKAVSGVLIVVTLMLVQQRTVWVVVLAAFFIWAVRSLGVRADARYRRLAAGGVGMIGVAAVVLAGIGTGSVMGRNLAEMTSSNSTLRWRVVGWSQLLAADRTVPGLIFGYSFGTGYQRPELGIATDVSPHSFYVGSLLRLGAIGLLALVFLYWNAWSRRREAAAALGVSPLTASLLLAALVIFSVTYEPGSFFAAVIAGLLVWEPRNRQAPAVAAAPTRSLSRAGR